MEKWAAGIKLDIKSYEYAALEILRKNKNYTIIYSRGSIISAVYILIYECG